MSRDFTPTPEQREAISARGSALLISAGAGSGKTRVLTERLISYLTDENDPRDVDEFLIITYTRASAGELRSRILSAIAVELENAPGNRHMRRQTALVHRAQIETIHGFCGRILRENAHALGISPDFRIAEESECELIKDAVLDRVLDDRYERIDEFEGFEALVDALSPGRGDARLGEIALGVYEGLRSHFDAEKWITEQLMLLRPGVTIDVANTPWGALLLDKARRAAEYWDTRLGDIIMDIAENPEALHAYGDCFAEALGQLQNFLVVSAYGWDSAREAANFTFSRAKPLRGDGYDDIKAAWKLCREELRDISDIFPASSEELARDMGAVYPVTAALFALVSDFSEAYEREKNRRKIVDFSDLEHLALRLLTQPDTNEPTDIARDVSRRYAEIMVDEYQDVSAIQERIFNAVSRDGTNLVTVGDVRQSIYRFRLAEPTIFLKKYNAYGDADDEFAPGRRVILSQNFRSRAAVLDAVNLVFSRVMSESFGEMDYTPREYLLPGRTDASGGAPVELDMISSAGDDDSPDKRTAEAAFIANRIRALVETERSAEYGDVVILLRARTNAKYYRDALKALGVPVSSPEPESLFDRAEVELALALLSVIDNPRDDIPLIAVLRSPVYAFTPDELAEIRLCDRDCDFYSALEKYAEGDEKARLFLAELDDFRALAPELGAERMLWHVYNRTRLPELAGTLANGSARRGGLMRLVSEAARSAAVGRGSVFEFLRYIKRLRERGFVSSEEGDGDAGAVRIMTIHKSKGLEFPVVFLADMSKRFNFGDSRKQLLFHRELGAGLKLVDTERRIEYPTLPRLAIAEQLNSEMMSEELRVLYVAMTRAKERLIITYAAPDARKAAAKLAPQMESPVPPHVLARQPGVGDILLLAALSLDASALFDVRYIDAADVSEEHVSAETAPVPAPELAEYIPFEYPHPIAPDLPSKLTVTEIKNRAADSELAEDAQRALPHERAYRRPDFITQKAALTGAERGTALHLAMRLIELRDYADAAELSRELDALAERGLMTPEQRATADEGAILRFLRSDLGRRVLAADEKFREFKFSLLTDAEEFFPGGSDDKILFQGVVDLAIREGDALTVIDFKTDRLLGDDTVRAKTELYTPQVRAYMRALTRVTGLPAREGIIYFFDNGTAVEV